jgi:hypothetical protein
MIPAVTHPGSPRESGQSGLISFDWLYQPGPKRAVRGSRDVRRAVTPGNDIKEQQHEQDHQ